MIRLGVLSDTHLHAPSDWLREVFAAHLAECAAVVHCGDIGGAATWQWLESAHPQVWCVAGNMDGWSRGAPPERLSFRLGGLHIGATHGWGPRSQVAESVAAAFGPGYDLLLFGHTHRYSWMEIGGTRLLNPGSLQQFDAPSLAVVEIGPGGQLSVRQVRP